MSKHGRSGTSARARLMVASMILASAPAAALAQVSSYQTIRVVDAIVSNTDSSLNAMDGFTDHESSIAINPQNPLEVVVLGFSDGFAMIPNHPLFRTTDGGVTWTKVFSVPEPPGIPGTFVNDWTPDWGRNNQLSITMLAPSDIITVVTNNAIAPSAYAYRIEDGAAQLTNHLVPGSLGNADQPWTLTNRDTALASQDNVYTAWDDFANSDGIDGPDMHVTVSYGVTPLDFTVDRQVGNSTGGINPGLRMAKDPTTGTMYALWQRCVGSCGLFDSPKTINYMLNRSTDGGHTWALNGNPMGVIIATANSTQPWPKFGGVNALLGGVHHAAVDPRNGAVYYAYGSANASGVDRIAIRRLTFSAGNVVIGPETIVSALESAIPQVAVDNNGTVGVFFYSFDGMSAAGRPNFRAHLSLSANQGVAFTDRTLLAFESPEAPDGDDFDAQRVLGDFEQMKSLDSCFYGGFTGNGAALGRPFDNTDPIYFQVCQVQVQNPCLLTNGPLTINDRSVATATVDAGALFTLGSQGRINGNVLGGDGAFLRNNATVNGDVTLAGVLQHQTVFTITGTLTENAAVTIPTLATRTVAAGTGTQTIANNAVVTLPPGQYGNMTINAGARVTLLAGTYNFLSLNIQPDVTIIDNAVTNVNVAGALTWSDRVRVQSTITHPLTVYTNTANVRIGTDAIFNGFLLAPNASLNVASRTSFLGCLGARNATFEPAVTLNSGGSTLPSSATM
jgi:hypothetical protein